MAATVTKFTAADIEDPAELLQEYEKSIEFANGWSGGLFFGTEQEPAKEYRDLDPEGGYLFKVTVELVRPLNEKED